MAQATAMTILQRTIINSIKYVLFMINHIRRKNPIKKFINESINSIKEMLLIKKKLQKIENMIKYEKYKYKKTELILAQNTDHFFLNGKAIDQRR
ncbi:hypothetical protein IJ182_01635 [bacterium]|nr:hypothetical protein [bacterium]